MEDLYRKKYAIAIYDGDRPVGVFDNAFEISECLHLWLPSVKVALNKAFIKERKSILIDGSWCTIHFIRIRR